MPRKGKITINTSDVRHRLGVYQGQVFERAKLGMQVKVANDENRAKANRPWTDRTGEARRTTTGSWESSTDTIRGALAIGADHGQYLELAHGANWAIIWPTILENRRELLDLGRLALMSGRR